MFCKQHLRDNKGDANVSKMTLIAVVFVVGAILLVLTTSAFRNPINRWFSTVTKDWFADSNGMFEADNRYMFAEREFNGTLKGAVYVLADDNGVTFMVLSIPQDLQNGVPNENIQTFTNFNGNGGLGSYVHPQDVVISEDGRTITVGTDVYTGYLQGDPDMPQTERWMCPW